MKEERKRPTLSGARYSASQEASRKAELDEICRMTPLERMELALSLGEALQTLTTRPATAHDHS